MPARMLARVIGGRKEATMNPGLIRGTRRQLVLGAAGALALTRLPGPRAAALEIADTLVIDLDGDLESIHPSLAYSGRDWSIVNSIYDSLVMIDAKGKVVPLAAERFETDDAKTFSVALRQGLTFHDGTPVTADAIKGSWEFLMATESLAASQFAVIDDVRVEDDRNASIICSSPAPWLPVQIATWMMLVPPGYTDDQALTAPVGTGPYTLGEYAQGQDVDLKRFAGYQLAAIKGEALAEEVTFRIVPDAATRVADIATGTAQIVDQIPQDFRAEAEGQGATVLDDPLVGSQWIRIATDVAPFDDQRVRQALNYAVDKDSIVAALLGPETRALGSILPDDRAPGFVEAMEPYPYDPDKAKSLLAEAGVDGVGVKLEQTQSARKDVAEVIAQNLTDVGVDVEVVATDLATFNAGWTDPNAPALRLVTWSPLYEPHSLLSLVFSSDGALSRYSDDQVDALIAEAATEADPATRRETYEKLNEVMHDDAPVIFLWNLTATYGVDGAGEAWHPTGNEQIVPTSQPEI
jgi:peptide/nickel transport system substrate-binding protein